MKTSNFFLVEVYLELLNNTKLIKIQQKFIFRIKKAIFSQILNYIRNLILFVKKIIIVQSKIFLVFLKKVYLIIILLIKFINKNTHLFKKCFLRHFLSIISIKNN